MMKSRNTRWVRRVACMEQMRNSYAVVAGMPEKKYIPLKRPRHRWGMEC
jgi:hypothetical protein